MTLNDRQIERYSRQILVTSGAAQERLLAASVVLVGDPRDVEPPLRYLVGAGVGRIHLQLTNRGDSAGDGLLAEARALDSKVTISVQEPGSAPDLILLVGSGAMLRKSLEPLAAQRPSSIVVCARLDPPMYVAIGPIEALHSRIIDRDLSAAPAGSGSARSMAGFVSMITVSEVLKLLMSGTAPIAPAIIEFDGYATRRIPLA